MADSIGELIGRPVSRQRGWEYLKQMRFRLRVPRAEHQQSRQQEQAECQKKVGDQGGKNTNSTPRIRRGTMGNG